MRLDDYVCSVCGTEFVDGWGDEVCCGAKVVKDWSRLNPKTIANDTMDRSGTKDVHGRIMRATVKDCARSKEILMNSSRTRISNGEVEDFRRRLAVDGDSFKLRREILAADSRASGKDDAYQGRE